MTTLESYKYLGKLLWLNLDFTTLYGFENENSARKIDSIIKGIELGDDFPPVFVYRFPNGEYRLTVEQDPLDNKNLGGHHRAIAHYIEGKPLKCLVIRDSKFEYHAPRNIKIEDLTMIDYGAGCFEHVKERDARYR